VLAGGDFGGAVPTVWEASGDEAVRLVGADIIHTAMPTRAATATTAATKVALAVDLLRSGSSWRMSHPLQS
jgi:hypothetical protein